MLEKAVEICRSENVSSIRLDTLPWNLPGKRLYESFGFQYKGDIKLDYPSTGKISFRTISGNPRQFNYRDESAGLCVSAQKYNNKNLFLLSPDSCIGFRKKASRICVENQEHFVL